MKKFIYLLAGLALAAGITSCEDSKEPQYQNPTTFKLNTPALQDELLMTTGDMDDKSTFNLFCSQPDYGFSAVCEYGVQVSLTENFVDATEAQEANYVSLTNQSASQSAMTFRTYDLAVAMTELLGITSAEEGAAYDGPDVMPVFFRATCRIPGVKGSEIVSQNVVKYSNVRFFYAIPTAGVIYIVGHVFNPENEASNNFQEPSEGFKEFYEDFKLVEPVIGCKLYAGTFYLKECSGGAENPDNCAQFRFFTELKGWADKSVQVASNPNDFYVEPITDSFVDGLFKGNAVYGQGNWGIYTTETEAAERTYTFVVSLQDKEKPKLWLKKGTWDVEVVLDSNNMNEPSFVAPAE
ncbi:MAG: SusE domain-containing protein [Bacteroidales bacterium]|nr:SusE domain-containing protein [Bacteroidales bacterium]